MDATYFDGRTTSPITAADVASVGGGAYTWIDVDVAQAGSIDQARVLLQALGMGTNQQDLLLKPNRSAKLHVEGGTVDCVAWVGGEADGAPPPEVHLSWTSTRMVTVRWGGGEAVARIRQEITARATQLFAEPESLLGVVLLLMNTSIDRRLTVLDLQLNDIDDAIVAGNAKTVQSRLRSLRGEVTALQLRYGGLVDASSGVLVDPSALPGMTPDVMKTMQNYGTHVRDTYHHIRELADGARGALQDYQTGVSDKQGDRINQLTIVSVVFLPVSFLTGYFGMNFQWLDNQLMTLSSWVVWGIVLPMLVLAVSLLALRRFGFLGRLGLASGRSDSSGSATGTSPGTDPAPATQPGSPLE
jgi:Mg2+ and Co2+ transporter CorA